MNRVYMLVVAASAACMGQTVFTFDEVAPGALPVGWKVEATIRAGNWNEPGREQAPLGEWKVIADQTAPSGKQALSLTRIGYDPAEMGQIFNLCWTDGVSFDNGEIAAKMKYDTTGVVDLGGGVIWRVQDRNNYYLARYNPLEAKDKGFCIYLVKNAYRTTLKQMATAATSPSRWHTIRIIHKGALIEGYLNDKKYFSVNDTQITKAGGIGVWTKADALSMFDDFAVTGPSAGVSSIRPRNVAETESVIRVGVHMTDFALDNARLQAVFGVVGAGTSVYTFRGQRFKP